LGFLVDLHSHTKRHSQCSQIEPEALIYQAVKAGLDALVITEHHYQWSEADLEDLVERSGELSFPLLAGFEFMTQCGDVLVYGAPAREAQTMKPGMPPNEAVRAFHEMGAVCIAAHPTRMGMGFDERLLNLPVDAIEVCSVNLKEHEQRLAAQLAKDLGIKPVAASDAHQIRDVGRYATDFDDPIRTMKDLQESLRRGRFRPAGRNTAHTKAG